MNYFKLSEFDSPDEPGSGALIKQELIDKLNIARALAERPFKITSGYRTKDHNKLVGGKSNSSHLRGEAADVECTSSRDRFFMLVAFFGAGFDRIGIGEDFIHVDVDKGKAASVIWDYYN